MSKLKLRDIRIKFICRPFLFGLLHPIGCGCGNRFEMILNNFIRIEDSPPVRVTYNNLEHCITCPKCGSVRNICILETSEK
jgi:hypothetical protein